MQAKLAVGLAAATLLYGVTAFAIGASGASVSDPAITVSRHPRVSLLPLRSFLCRICALADQGQLELLLLNTIH